MRPRPAGHHRGEHGAAAAELAVVAPLLLVLLAGVVFAGRLARAEGQVEGAARDAARAAAARRTTAAATAAAQEEAEASLRAAGITCAPLGVAVDTGRFHPGGAVGVQVTCTVSLADLQLLGLPGATTRRAAAQAPIDLYRGTG
ncbi:MAG TPA: TadE/TadG family type IV pilus assembly protein [Actinomycetes bacterium]|nr:TadE/TadG family type IV pilus assembly protein [Actinomycetes bacterium]